MKNQAEQVQSILDKMDKVENIVIMDFTKSVVSKPKTQRVYQFPQEIGDMLLGLYKEKLQYANFQSIRRSLIDDIRETDNMENLKKQLVHFMESREFIDNVANNTLEQYKTESFGLPTEMEFYEENAHEVKKVDGKYTVSAPTGIEADEQGYKEASLPEGDVTLHP